MTTNNPKPRRVVLVICDGLGAEWMSPALTPEIHALSQRSRVAACHRAVYPSVTRVSAASIATGHHPGQHGLHGNQMALSDGARLVVHNAGLPDFRDRMRRATGRTLQVPTLAQRIAHHGGQVAYSNVSAGGAYFLDPDHHGTVCHRSGSFGPEGIALKGKQHLAVSHDLAGDKEMTAKFCAQVLERNAPALAILWLANPDLTLHHHPLGSPEHLDALRVVDALVSSVVSSIGQTSGRYDTLLMVGSDHGHETIGKSVHIGNWIASVGYEAEIRDGQIAVASQGNSALLYVVKSIQPRMGPLLARMARQPWAGRIYTQAELAELKFPTDGDLFAAVDMERTEVPNAYGVPGARWMVEDGEERPEIGCGQHGGLGPQETNPFLLLAHSGIPVSRVETPTSLIDIAPTILDFLGVTYEGLSGQSLLV